jgi:hypothetical protein
MYFVDTEVKVCESVSFLIVSVAEIPAGPFPDGAIYVKVRPVTSTFEVVSG